MEDNMNTIALKFLKTIKTWVDKRIPEKTQDCLRTKIGIVMNVVGNKCDVILVGDYGSYLDLKDKLDGKEITQEEYNTEVSLITLEDLISIKNETYNIGDNVVIGIIDNKLTNAFILFKTFEEGV